MLNWVGHIGVYIAKFASLPGKVDDAERRIMELEKRVMFLEVFKEMQQGVTKMLYDLKALGENQKAKLNNLARMAEVDIVPKLNELADCSPDNDYREQVLSLRRQLRNNATRAKRRVSEAG